MSSIRIAVIDDQHLFRQGLAMIIKSISDFELVLEAPDGRQFLHALSYLDQLPDIALVDLNMPHLNGVELSEQMRQQYPAIKIIVVTVYSQARYVAKMVENGASGYLLKNCSATELESAIRSVYKTGFYFTPQTMQTIAGSLRRKQPGFYNINNIPVELTPRETDILQLICEEYTNPEIAQKLFLSPRTVDGYRNSLLAKVGCRNTAGLVIFAIRYELFKVVF